MAGIRVFRHVPVRADSAVTGFGKCDACQEHEAAYHFTLRVTITGSTSRHDRVKVINFALCPLCEKANRQVWANDYARRRRIALRMVHEPEFYSRFRDWRGRAYQSDPER